MFLVFNHSSEENCINPLLRLDFTAKDKVLSWFVCNCNQNKMLRKDPSFTQINIHLITKCKSNLFLSLSANFTYLGLISTSRMPAISITFHCPDKVIGNLSANLFSPSLLNVDREPFTFSTLFHSQKSW